MIRAILLSIPLLFHVIGPTLCEAGETLNSVQSTESGKAASTEYLTEGTRESYLEEGAAVFKRVCIHCHGRGVSGAPAIGDREAWKVRIPEGIDNLVRNAIDGYQGNLGVHPPRGGDRELSDEEIEAAVRFMVEQAGEVPAN